MPVALELAPVLWLGPRICLKVYGAVLLMPSLMMLREVLLEKYLLAFQSVLELVFAEPVLELLLMAMLLEFLALMLFLDLQMVAKVWRRVMVLLLLLDVLPMLLVVLKALQPASMLEKPAVWNSLFLNVMLR
mmetsp:Transcript_20630/g.37141  ORF Transcript_20630/g.37141 Transcript_20630/m.37141 type:complete len:132 (-) Transcript_20630:2281-2676(-)